MFDTVVPPCTLTLHSSPTCVCIPPLLHPLVFACHVFDVFLLLTFPSSTSTSRILTSSLAHPFCTLANRKLLPLRCCSNGGYETHWTWQFYSFALKFSSILYMVLSFSTKYSAVGKLLKRWVFYWWKVTRAPCLSFFLLCVCVFYFWLVCILGSPPGGGGVPRPFWDHLTCLCWPDVNQLVPRLFSLAEYGSAGERSRRAKKRNIGRYTRLMINSS